MQVTCVLREDPVHDEGELRARGRRDLKALHGWQAALDATRRTRAVAEARAEHARYRAPQGGSSRRRGAKRSAPPEVPVEELTIRESDCLPYEYEGPPMATMGGGGGCVIA
jgi:hypothetical protein